VSINAAGRITGAYEEAGYQGYRGFVRSPTGEFALFDFPGAIATAPTGMNDLGVIVGYYYIGDTSFGFLRVPAVCDKEENESGR
jgi:hypothetical protein